MAESAPTGAKQRLWQWTGTRSCALAAAGTVLVAAAVYLFATNDLYETVAFDTDQMHHQFLGVNLARGHGYQVGPVDRFESYRISNPLKSHDYYQRFIGPGFHEYSFGRTPGYPLFLAAIYLVAGVSPPAVAAAQILLLALAAAMLPLIGARLWSRSGLAAGSLAAFAFVAWYTPDPAQIMAETLMIAGLLGLILGYLHWTAHPTRLRALLLGLLTAAALLIRPNIPFVPPLLLLLIALRVRPLTRAAPQLGLHVAGILLPILVWSAYATAHNEEPGLSGRGAGPVFLSTQASRTLLDGNNEACFGDGRWHPEWRTQSAGDPRFLYNRILDEGRGTLSMLVAFWAAHPGRLPALMGAKLAATFGETRDLMVFLAMLACYLALAVRAWLRRRRGGGAVDPMSKRAADERPFLLPLLLLANLALTTVVMFGDPRFAEPFVYAALLPAAHLPILLVASARQRIYNRRSQ